MCKSTRYRRRRLTINCFKILPDTGKYSGEKHIPGYNYCGPGTRLDIRLDENDKPNPGNEPVNDIDKTCYKHDIDYRDHKDIENRQIADVKLIHDLNAIKKLKFSEKLVRMLIKNIMKAKITFGGNYSLRNNSIPIENLKDTMKLGNLNLKNFNIDNTKKPMKLEPSKAIENDKSGEALATELHERKALATELHKDYRKPNKY